MKAAASPGSARTPTYQLPARRLSDWAIVSPIGTVSVNWLAEWRTPVIGSHRVTQPASHRPLQLW